jgi:CheY-like chemotaxis protein
MPKTLLLADDSVTIQKVVAIVFATEDYRITSVDNGEDALRKARETRPDIVLADAVMPRMNGYELCQAIKADPQLADVPVLLLAGTFEPFDEARARAARADGHIAKPFESHALLTRVRELVEGVSAEPPPQPYARGPAAPAPSRIPTSVPPPVPPRRAVPPPFAPPTRPAPRAGAMPMPGAGVRPGALPAPAARPMGARPPMPGVPRPSGAPVRPPPFPPAGSAARGVSPAPRPFAPAPPRSAPPVRPPPPPEPFGFAPPMASDDDWSDVSTGEVALRPPVQAPRRESHPPVAAPAAAPGVSPVVAVDGGEAALRLAISQASREVIERIAWEVVPQLAEVIIREHVERLVNERQKR